jgi:uncharacterized tellurite resistance protein B-like protein
MFNKLKSIFDKKIGDEVIEFNTLQIAISSLMIQTAIYDGAFDEVEKNKILALIKNYFQLDGHQMNTLFKTAMEVSDNANDLQQFTRVLNDNLTEDEKLDIIRMLWTIIIADGHIDDYENALIRKISGLLYIQDKDVGHIKKEIINKN